MMLSNMEALNNRHNTGISISHSQQLFCFHFQYLWILKKNRIIADQCDRLLQLLNIYVLLLTTFSSEKCEFILNPHRNQTGKLIKNM